MYKISISSLNSKQFCREYIDQRSIMMRGRAVGFVVDNTEFEIKTMMNNVSSYTFSGKKHKYTLSVLFYVLPNGEIRFFSASNAGSIPDITFASLPENQIETYDFGVILDKGYIGLGVYNPDQLMLPVKDVESLPLFVQDECRSYNSELKRIRLVVENTFGDLKKFKILSMPFSVKGGLSETKEKFDMVLAVCVYLQTLVHPNGIRK